VQLNRGLLLAASIAAIPVVALAQEHAQDRKKIVVGLLLRVWPLGALDWRHPEASQLALMRIKSALKPNGQFFIDGGDPLKEIDLHGG
jgi:hypothetical protein